MNLARNAWQASSASPRSLSELFRFPVAVVFQPREIAILRRGCQWFVNVISHFGGISIISVRQLVSENIAAADVVTAQMDGSRMMMFTSGRSH